MSDRFSTHAGGFHTTRWSVVIGAQGRSPRDTRMSLDAFYRQYASPLYGYVRRRGHSPHDAQDITQEFFARLVEKDWLSAADRERGRLRTFLLTVMKRFLANEWRHARTGKRGGGSATLSLHCEEAEHLCRAAAAAALPDESFYDRNWALALMNATMAQLSSEYEASLRLSDFEVLKTCLTAERGDIDYTAIAASLGLLPVSARSVVHRFRKRFREIFRQGVACTVASPEDIDDEMRALVSTLGHL